jgi:metacaspase-1
MCFAGGMNDLDGPGRVILMASAEKGYAYEGDEWENGEFTYYLKNGMGGEAKVYDYGMDAVSLGGPVTVEEAFDYTKANCVYGKPEIIDNFPYDLWP